MKAGMSMRSLHHEELSCMLQGYIFGGVIAGPLGWRAAFWIEAAAMLPFVLFCALAPPINLKGMHTGADLLPRQDTVIMAVIMANSASIFE